MHNNTINFNIPHKSPIQFTEDTWYYIRSNSWLTLQQTLKAWCGSNSHVIVFIIYISHVLLLFYVPICKTTIAVERVWWCQLHNQKSNRMDTKCSVIQTLEGLSWLHLFKLDNGKPSISVSWYVNPYWK